MRIALAVAMLCAMAGVAVADPIPGAPGPKKTWYQSSRGEVAAGYVVDGEAPSVGIGGAKIVHPYVDVGARVDAVFADGVTLFDLGAEVRIFDLSASGGNGYDGTSGYKGRYHWGNGALYALAGLGYSLPTEGDGALTWRAGGGFDWSFNGQYAAFAEVGYTGDWHGDGSVFLRAGARF